MDVNQMIFPKRRADMQGVERAARYKLLCRPAQMYPRASERIDVGVSQGWISLSGQNPGISCGVFLDDIELDLRPVSDFVESESLLHPARFSPFIRSVSRPSLDGRWRFMLLHVFCGHTCSVFNCSRCASNSSSGIPCPRFNSSMPLWIL